MSKTRMKTIRLPVNRGHAAARQASLDGCTNELAALMDSDDLSLPDRFEKQLRAFAEQSDADVVGGQITEFVGEPTHIVGRRVVPETDAEIRAYMQKRCPMNQVSVMLKRSSAARAGGYIDWYCEEDYYLWLRMAEQGAKFANLPDTLVNVRIGSEMSARRGGWKYFRSEAKLQAYMLKKKVISPIRFLYNVGLRFGGEIVLPNSLRMKAFRLLRDENETVPTEKTAVTATENSNLPPFSVAMTVYGGDRAEWFDAALRSVLEQTVPPDEIVLAVDGPVPDEIRRVIEKYEEECR